MNKSEFMRRLKHGLRIRKVNDISEILSDYEEHFTRGYEEFKTEEEIVEELGSIDVIVNEYAKNEKMWLTDVVNNDNATRQVKAGGNNGTNTAGLVLLIIFDVIFGIAIAAIIFSVTIGFIATSVSLVAFGGVFAVGSFIIFGSMAVKFAGFFIAIGIVILGVLAAMLIKPLIKSLILLIKQYVKFHIKVAGGNV